MEPLPADEIEIPQYDSGKSLKPRRIALRAFAGLFSAIVLSAAVYLVSRQGPKPAAPKEEPKPFFIVAGPAAPPAQLPVPASEPAKPAVAEPAQLEQPQANRMYLQVGSLDKGVAEVLAQGLRAKGIPATVAPGVTSIVSRIIAGPFETNQEAASANKMLTDLGFKPFPRRFEPKELKQLLEQASASLPANDVRR